MKDKSTEDLKWPHKLGESLLNPPILGLANYLMCTGATRLFPDVGSRRIGQPDLNKPIVLLSREVNWLISLSLLRTHAHLAKLSMHIYRGNGRKRRSPEQAFV